jgi:hypothetical protein
MKSFRAILVLVLSLGGCGSSPGGAPGQDTGTDRVAAGDLGSRDAAVEIAPDVPAPPTVGALVAQVSEDALGATLAALSDPASGGFSTRHTGSPGFGDVTDYLVGRCEALGLETSLHSWEDEVGGAAYAAANVICARPGVLEPGAVLLIGAHYDSAVDTPPDDPAPGAGDNGSGVAAALEMARILSGVDPTVTVRFVFFAGEEQGFLGSLAYVERLGDDGRAAVELMLNLDQVGRINTPSGADYCEPAPAGAGGAGVLGACLESFAAHGDLVDEIQGVGAAYTTLFFRRNLSAFGSDHVPFLLAGVPTVMAIEAYDGANPIIHSVEDVFHAVDLDLVAEITRLGVAVIALRAGVAP